MQNEFDTIYFTKPLIDAPLSFQCCFKIKTINGYEISVAGDNSQSGRNITLRHAIMVTAPSGEIVTQKIFETISDEFYRPNFNDIMRAYNWCMVQKK